MSDPALFEMTAEEYVAKARLRLERAVERAQTKVDKAEEKVELAEAELSEFDAAIAAVRGDHAD